MIFIKSIGTKEDKNFELRGFAVFFCEYCKLYVERPLYYKKCPSCGCNRGRGKKKPEISGENHWNWNNGSSFEPYGIEFNKELKQQILERDNYKCQDSNCDRTHKKLHIHHIDYYKKNNNPENLITLCNSCHAKTNIKNKRQYYTEFYQNIIYYHT